MIINRCDAWRIGDKTFFTRASAQDHVDDLINRRVKALLTEEHFTESDCYKITVALLSDKARMADLLSTTVEDDV